jgi:hypothetical protein
MTRAQDVTSQGSRSAGTTSPQVTGLSGVKRSKPGDASPQVTGTPDWLPQDYATDTRSSDPRVPSQRCGLVSQRHVGVLPLMPAKRSLLRADATHRDRCTFVDGLGVRFLGITRPSCSAGSEIYGGNLVRRFVRDRLREAPYAYRGLGPQHIRVPIEHGAAIEDHSNAAAG